MINLQSLLTQLESQALTDGIPIIEKQAGLLLHTLVAIARPKSILEIGTAIGYSGILMLSAYDEAYLTTVEKTELKAGEAKINFQKAGFGNRVTVVTADAMDFLPSCKQMFDFIFLDAAKEKYPLQLPFLKNLLTKNGILIADNVTTLPHSIKPSRRMKKIQEFNELLKSDPDLKTTVIKIGEGLSVSVLG